jgi:hypothetical protein
MLTWETDKAEVAARLRDDPRAFRIILKTKDETDFLKDWVSHHRRIVGDEGLVIFDNGSTAPEVLEYYSSIADRVLVVGYAAYVNSLHRPQEMPELYAALRASTRYFTFIDTDEFLYWFTETGECLSGRGLLANLLAKEELVIPGLWLDNVEGFRTRLWLNEQRRPLLAAVRSGKPVLSAELHWDGMSNHNFHLPEAVWDGCGTGNMVVAHMSRLYPRQRIRANMAKLRADRFMEDGLTLEAVITCELEGLAPSARQYVREIQTLVRAPFPVGDMGSVLRSGSVEIRDGRVVFPNPQEEGLFRAFLESPNRLLRTVLQPVRPLMTGQPVPV